MLHVEPSVLVPRNVVGEDSSQRFRTSDAGRSGFAQACHGFILRRFQRVRQEMCPEIRLVLGLQNGVVVLDDVGEPGSLEV
jgi:hypothetical protein